MIPVVVKPVLEKDIPFNHIVSFKTEGHIGIWCSSFNEWLLVLENDVEFYPELIDDVDSLEKLDKAVYDICDEHIESVSEYAAYKLTLTEY